MFFSVYQIQLANVNAVLKNSSLHKGHDVQFLLKCIHLYDQFGHVVCGCFILKGVTIMLSTPFILLRVGWNNLTLVFVMQWIQKSNIIPRVFLFCMFHIIMCGNKCVFWTVCRTIHNIWGNRIVFSSSLNVNLFFSVVILYFKMTEVIQENVVE